MKYHIALSVNHDLEVIAKTATAGKCPSHIMWDISKHLGARIYQPSAVKVAPIDKMLAKIIGSPEQWALARQLSPQLKEDDVIYCDGEYVGIPIAVMTSASRHRPKIVMYTQNINRPRGRLALKLFNLKNKVDLFMAGTSSQAELLRRYLPKSENRVYKIPCQAPVDISFFTPGVASSKKLRPIIGSGGLEKRDYQTLALATSELDVDVKICAFSPSTTARQETFPKVMPENMSCRFYDWCDLVQLYRDSDIVVLPLFENNYQAGLTTLFEAMACRRPVIVTRSEGIIGDLIDSDAVTGVNPCDPDGLKQAIEKLLDNPEKASAQAQRGYELVTKEFNNSKYIQDFAKKLISTFESVNTNI
ncbi:putative glycosyl transferase [Calothrix sp. NIES-4071]|nr:putative glycosyl transferase [Calothrix sp. NIES-4071]BAZ55839.1 putative glycosyl transferase [Calothrix sp. NIES-4105]